MSQPSADADARARSVLADLAAEIDAETVHPSIHDDGSNMTPMLAVEFDHRADKAGVLRTLFDAEGPVEVTGIYDHRVVVRIAREGD